MTPSTSPDSGLATLLAVQRKAFLAEGAPTAEERRADLTQLCDLLTGNRKAIKAALREDFGARSAYETEIADIATTLHTVKFARRNVAKWMKPRKRSTGIWFLPAANRIVPQPKGCIGIIVPFNFPINLAMGPLTSAVAAGNRAMLKMSELTPNVGELFARLIAERFPAEKIVVVNGGLEVSQEFASLPFDHLLFTGSTAVGRHIMRAAAENLTPVTLELGGKSPVIVGEDYPLAWAAERIVWGKLLNAGQICIAPDYVLVPQGKEREFAAYAQAAARKHYPKLAGNDDYTAVINDHHYQRLTDTLADARSKGAVIESAADPAESRSERKLPLTVVLDPNDDMRVMQDEIFGPVLPVRGYGS
ncbi:MAG: aldehyde dehydrogenase family protein, partial [Actinobacteria bacterium]|nr:aldehyde dehydrogenase family protein [Actinomycetota bacterium]